MFDTQSLLPWNETATYISTGGSVGDVTVALPVASRYPIKLSEAADSGGVYTASDQIVTLDVAPLNQANVQPKPADRVIFGTTTWTVLEVRGSPSFLQFWSLVCRNLVLVYGLRSSLTVLRPTNNLDATAKRTPVLAAVYSGVPCRVQEGTDRVDPGYRESVAGRQSSTMYVGQRLFLIAGDVLQVDGINYDYAGSSNWDRIDQLGVVDLTRVV